MGVNKKKKNPWFKLTGLHPLVNWAEDWAMRSMVVLSGAPLCGEALQSPRGFSALASLYYLARPTKTTVLPRLPLILALILT